MHFSTAKRTMAAQAHTVMRCIQASCHSTPTERQPGFLCFVVVVGCFPPPPPPVCISLCVLKSLLSLYLTARQPSALFQCPTDDDSARPSPDRSPPKRIRFHPEQFSTPLMVPTTPPQLTRQLQSYRDTLDKWTADSEAKVRYISYTL